MKRSQLKEVIKSIVTRKLNENSENDSGVQLANFIRNEIRHGNIIPKIIIQGYQGNKPLEIIEWWNGDGGELFISVSQNVEQGLQELSPAVTSTGAPVVPSVDDRQNQTDQMTEPEKKQIENAQKEQEKLTNDIRRLDGAKQKLLEPMKRKIQTLDNAKSSKEKKLGSITQKITSIQRKYSKV